MLQTLYLKNVGPAREVAAQFAPRLNLITGDNGLGKSFLLDIAWWTMTRRWPRELNPALTSGDMARPARGAAASIEFAVTGKSKAIAYRSSFSVQDQAWKGKAGRPLNPGLVLYAMADGGFAVWDPARNYWRKKGNIDVQDRMPAYVFGPREVWDGLSDPIRGVLCEGLVADWASWQKEAGPTYALLCSVLAKLSSEEGEPLSPGPFARLSVDDARRVPTLAMPYGQAVPVVHASAGMKRMIALAYLLVWSWQEHVEASRFLDQKTASQVVFLIDEIEAHLHPRWQRSVVGALLEVVGALAPNAKAQLIVATHSPLVMASVEPVFDARQDAWFDLDLVRGAANRPATVSFEQRPFVRRGDASRWLMSEAFDLKSAGSLAAERVLAEAALAMSDASFDRKAARALHARLTAVLGDVDPFWIRWRHVGEARGWWGAKAGAGRRPRKSGARVSP